MGEKERKQRELKDLILANREKRRNLEILKSQLELGFARERTLSREIGKISSRGCPALKRRRRGSYAALYSCLLRDNLFSQNQFRELYCSICRLRKRRDFAVRVIAIKIEQKDFYAK